MAFFQSSQNVKLLLATERLYIFQHTNLNFISKYYSIVAIATVYRNKYFPNNNRTTSNKAFCEK